MLDLQAANSMVSSTVRMLAIFHELKPNQPGALWQTRAMRLIRPNDEIGSKLWFEYSMHCDARNDCWSPLLQVPSLVLQRFQLVRHPIDFHKPPNARWMGDREADPNAHA
ncbi:hypothetical protein BASA81_012386 [Batrachochytrium salamandrivorans]|nr:hypothetical protein BASA81_012386 [Batrachochytrium salamandrivorans]